MEAVNNEVDKVIWDSEKLDILALFEDICPQFLEEIGEQHGFMRDAVITAILDRQDQGKPYPKRAKSRKRKRDDNEVEDAESHSATVAAKIESPAYGLRLRSATYRDFATLLITQDFPMIPKPTVRRKLLGENRHSLFKTYSFIDNAMRRRNGLDPGLPWQNKRVPTKSLEEYSPANIANLNMEALCENQRAALDEFVAARAVRQQKDEKQAAEAAELANLEQAKLKGETAECGCCFDEYPLNRMVHCEGETTHWFCRTCMTEQAKTTIGYFKYELSCVSIDGCQAGFSASQKRNFLDDNLQLALDRIEQQAMLEQAGIENLEACPFCPFAMEYPPMRENKEFRCANPGCEIVSCRLCRKETHVPKSCAEAAAEESSRHVVEEAMSEALIRKCNKCANPYIKLHHSCNKVTCTRCGTIQCYVCRKTVKDYSHFNDVNRGGKHGQCPLFDNTDERHEREVRSAEENSKPQANQNNIQPTPNSQNFDILARDEIHEPSRQHDQNHGIKTGNPSKSFENPKLVLQEAIENQEPPDSRATAAPFVEQGGRFATPPPFVPATPAWFQDGPQSQWPLIPPVPLLFQPQPIPFLAGAPPMIHESPMLQGFPNPQRLPIVPGDAWQQPLPLAPPDQGYFYDMLQGHLNEYQGQAQFEPHIRTGESSRHIQANRPAQAAVIPPVQLPVPGGNGVYSSNIIFGQEKQPMRMSLQDDSVFFPLMMGANLADFGQEMRRVQLPRDLYNSNMIDPKATVIDNQIQSMGRAHQGLDQAAVDGSSMDQLYMTPVDERRFVAAKLRN